MSQDNQKNTLHHAETQLENLQQIEEQIRQFVAQPDPYRAELLPLMAHLDDEGQALVQRAYDAALFFHRGQRRLSGDVYIVHLLEVVRILSQYKLDAPTLATGLLHDLIEEKTEADLPLVTQLFGKEIAGLVDGVTKLTGLFSRQEREVHRCTDKSSKGHESAIENLRRIFLAMASDLRVILVKLADRLHNLRNLQYCEPAVQLSISKETIDIFAPIASRLGIWEFKGELEDLSFRYVYPDEYKSLTQELERSRASRTEVMENVLHTLEVKLKELGITSEVEHRSKHLYSVFKKLSRGKTLDEVYDLTAIRVIVNTIEECYTIFGIIHSLWSPINGRIKDYIARPKANNYRSLHTTVIGPHNTPVEIQIRTFEMHRINEVGIAAHWAYKEGRRQAGKESAGLFANVYPWIRALLDWRSESHEQGDYASHLQLNLLNKEVFVFTPRGDVIDLPEGSTPIDFAYRIHTDVGHRCVGAVVNKKMVPLTYKLVNADVVDIQTAKNGTPSRDWLRICASHQAQAKIRAWLKKERREENILRGREALRAEAKRLRQDDFFSDDEIMQQVAESLSFVNFDDLLASIGYGETSVQRVVSRVQNIRQPEELPTIADLSQTSKNERRTGPGHEIIVKNMDSILTKLARCCSPVPGDDITGYISLGKGVSVHRSDCTNMAALGKLHPERIIEVEWNQQQFENDSRYSVGLEVEAWDRQGLVSDILILLNDMKVSVKGCQAWSSADRAQLKIIAEVSSRKQMEEVMGKLRRVKSVASVTRSRKN